MVRNNVDLVCGLVWVDVLFDGVVLVDVVVLLVVLWFVL